MTNWTAPETIAVIGAVITLIGAFTTSAISIIQVVKANVRVEELGKRVEAQSASNRETRGQLVTLATQVVPAQAATIVDKEAGR